ncbi:VRR-NUC domain-containing protein [Bradyrhizobium sp. USDA 4508]
MIAFACRVDHDPREPSEHKLQSQVIDLIDIGKTHPDIYAFAIPNAGRRGFKTAAKMKAEGLRAGVADVCIMLPESRAAWLEMKKRKGGRQSDEQKGFEARCKRLGHPYALARTLDEAIAALIRWGVLKPTNF